MAVGSWCVLSLGIVVAACGTPPARYPSWEPTSVTVPLVENRARALADLEVSRELWRDRGWHDYSYVRARQTSDDEVELTMIVVRGDHVVERSLSTAKTNADGLGNRMAHRLGRAPLLQWREEAHELGRHPGGARALSLDQLYDACRDRVLSIDAGHSPRLSFHRDGILQHCGFLRADCDDCETISVHALSAATPETWQLPADLMCTDRYGVFLPSQESLSAFGCEVAVCVANHVANPHPAVAEPIVDICRIDAAACPIDGLSRDHGNWFAKYLFTADGCDGGSFSRQPGPDCLALPRPTSRADPAWQLRCLRQR